MWRSGCQGLTLYGWMEHVRCVDGGTGGVVFGRVRVRGSGGSGRDHR